MKQNKKRENKMPTKNDESHMFSSRFLQSSHDKQALYWMIQHNNSAVNYKRERRIGPCIYFE